MTCKTFQRALQAALLKKTRADNALDLYRMGLTHVNAATVVKLGELQRQAGDAHKQWLNAISNLIGHRKTHGC